MSQEEKQKEYNILIIKGFKIKQKILRHNWAKGSEIEQGCALLALIEELEENLLDIVIAGEALEAIKEKK